MKLNLLDGILLAVMAFGVWRGFASGLIRELSQLFGVFVGFAFALQFMKPTAVFLVSVVNVADMPLEAAALLAFIVIFVLVYIIVFFAARLLERVANGAKLGPINKLFGGVFGVAKSALILSIILTFMGQIDLPGKKIESSSYLHGPIERIAPQAWEVFTSSVPTAPKMTPTVGERFWPKNAGDPEVEEDEAPAEN